MSEQTSMRRTPPSPKFMRSGQMVACLRRELLYSEKRPRDLLFGAIEELISTGPALMVSQLTREAALLARSTAEASGFDFENWEPASKAVMRALLMADALLTPDGTSIPMGITAQAAAVGGIRADYRDATEAFLLEFIIRRLGDVTTRDHTALAHALFRQFDPRVSRHELEDRVVVLLARLADRVALIDDAYAVRELEQA